MKGLQNLIQASSSKSYFIQISTDYVFKGDDGPYSEKDRTFPVNYYGKTKLEAENLLIGSRRKYLISKFHLQDFIIGKCLSKKLDA